MKGPIFVSKGKKLKLVFCRLTKVHFLLKGLDCLKLVVKEGELLTGGVAEY
jgi:hypothetical protein